MAEDLSKLTLVDLIDLLEPAPEPPAISMLPQTVGWVWLGVALLALIAFLALRWRAYRRANAYRGAALAALATAGDDPAKIAEILRRCALTAFPRNQVAGLIGAEWLRFLDETGGGTSFSSGPGKALLSAPYRPGAPVDGLSALAAGWIRRHRRPVP
ncbi:MAG: DUF4381 domain-containing protein [Pseudomonadota bacterium]